MSNSKVLLGICAIAVVALFVGGATPAAADPTGTTFDVDTVNFQGDGSAVGVPFGVSTSIPGSGVTIDSSVSTSVPVVYDHPILGPLPLTFGGLDLVSFDLTSDDSGYLAAVIGDPSVWAISGLNWGPGADPGAGAGLVFLSFDADGVFVEMGGIDKIAAGIPIVPNPTPGPAFGADSIPIDIAGDSLDPFVFDTFDLFGAPLFAILSAAEIEPGTALTVDSMHVGFEVVHVPIPEPASLALLGMGLCSTLLMRRRRIEPGI